MTFTDESLGGRSQDLTCAEANDKIIIDKLLVNKLMKLSITFIYSVHVSCRWEKQLTLLILLFLPIK
jgi:hypothetical protein